MILIAACACIAPVKEKQDLPKLGCQKLDCSVFVQRACVQIFCVSAWKRSFALKNPHPISVALQSAILPDTQEAFFHHLFRRERRIPFPSHSLSMVFAQMLEMRVLFRATKNIPSSTYEHNRV